MVEKMKYLKEIVPHLEKRFSLGGRAETVAPLVKRILKIPGLYKKVPKFFFKMTQKSFGAHQGSLMAGLSRS